MSPTIILWRNSKTGGLEEVTRHADRAAAEEYLSHGWDVSLTPTVHDRDDAPASRASGDTIRAGDRVFIKPEWQDAGDEKCIWIALEDEDGGRVRISPINGMWLAGLPTNQVAETSMLEARP